MIVPLNKLPAPDIHPFSLLSDQEREQLELAAKTDVSILFLGETGTGKGQMARAVAAISHRKKLIEVNCAALPDELLGSELFGHRKGAFTGAIADREGILVSSEGKTVFLDEIGEISMKMQRMLLGVVQRSRRSIKPLGSDKEHLLKPMRFIFATNRDLESEVRNKRFREDLLRRIDVVTVYLPALRNRADLIPGYVGKFLTELSGLHRIPIKGIDERALKSLGIYTWPGNVRELKNVLERSLVTAPRDTGVVITKRQLRFGTSVEKEKSGRFPSLAESEAEQLKKALRLSGGSVTKTMKLLGLTSRTSLYNRLNKHNITLDRVMTEGAD